MWLQQMSNLEMHSSIHLQQITYLSHAVELQIFHHAEDSHEI